MYAPLRISIAGFFVAQVASAALAGPADDQYQVAVGHYTQQRWEKAAQAFRSFAEAYPNDERADLAVFFIGESLTQRGQYAESRAAFLEFLRRKPGHAYARHALFRTGEAAYLTGQIQQARNELRQFHETYPQDALNAYALPYLGEIALTSGNPAEAVQRYRAALREHASGPLADECRFGLGRAHELQGNDDEAHRFYDFLAQNVRNPLADNALFQQGLLYRKGGQLERAEAALQTLDLRFADSELRTDGRYWLGLIQSEKQQWEPAKSTLLRALREDPEHQLAPAIEFAAAEALRKLAATDQAAQHYAHVLQRWPDSEWADDALQAAMQIALAQDDHHKIDRLANSFETSFPESPLRAFVLESLGRSQLKREQFAPAIETLEELVSLPGAAQATDTARRYLLALAYLGATNYRKVVRVLEGVQDVGIPKNLLAAIHLARASAFVGLEDYAPAAQSQRDFLQLHPEGEEAAKCRAQLALSLVHLGQWDEAVAAKSELDQLHPDSPHILPTTHFLAEAAYRQEEFELADRLFGELVAAGREHDLAAKGLLGLAWTQTKLGQDEQAVETFAELIRHHPAAPEAAEAAIMHARLLEEAGQTEAALKAYQLVFETYAESEHAAPARLAAAQLYAATGQDDGRRKAATLLDRVVRDDPARSDLDAVLYQLAWILVDLNRAAEANEVFQRLVADHPTSQYSSDALYRLAESAAAAGDYQEADRLVTQLLERENARDVRCHALYLKGQIAGTRQQWRDVIDPMRRLLGEFATSPLRVPARYWMAEAYYRLDDFENAAVHFETLHDETRDRTEAWLAMIPLRRAQIFAQDDRWREAYQLARGISQRFPAFRQQYEVDYLIGRYLASQAKFTQAREAYQRVIRAPAGNRTETAAMAQWMIGESFFHQKNYDEAIKAYHRVEILFEFPSWQAAALLQAAKCHELKGQWNEAIKLYAQLLKQYPDSSYSAQASERLKEAQQRSARRPQSNTFNS